MDRRFFAILLVSPLALVANPSGPSVVYGEAGFETAGAHLKVTASEKAIIEWNNFSIGLGETTQFIQPNAQSAVLNRVVSHDASELFGTLQSNGQVYLINQNGVIVGSSGCMQTGSFIASTFDVLNRDFIAGGDLVFRQGSQAHLINEGKIAALEGDVVLVGQFVSNSGEISAPNGLCAIGCGESVLLKESGEERLFILAPLQTELGREAGIQQKGLIEGLSAELKASGNPYALAVLHEGKIDALDVKREGGKVFLVAEKGNLYVSGSISAPKGDVHLHADQVVLAENSLIDVSSEWGGGSVHIGKDPAMFAEPKAIFTAPASTILADSLGQGDGGRVILWAEEMNLAEGSILARGGPLGGDGGFVEISSPRRMFPKGKVQTSAPLGATGTLLLDPCAVEISNFAMTTGATPASYPGCVAAMPISYDFTGSMTAHIKDTDLIDFLTCNDVTIDAAMTGTAGLGTGTITLLDTSAMIAWTSAGAMANPNPTILTLRADNSISIHQEINAMSSAATMMGREDIIVLEAPNINIISTSTAFAVTTASGNIRMTAAPTAFFPSPAVTITSGAGLVTVSTDSMTGGSIFIDTGTLALTSISGGCEINASKDITINATGNIDVTAGGSVAIINSVGTSMLDTHNVSITSTGGHLHLTGGASVFSSYAWIVSYIGSVSLDINQEIQLLGGTGSFAPAIISSAFTSGMGNLTISNAGDVILAGGSGPMALTMLGTGNPIAPGGDGTVSITCNGTAMNLTAGSGMSAFAQILTNGGMAANDISIMFINPASALTMLSSTAGSVAGVATNMGGTIDISGLGDLSLSGNGGGSSRIEVGASGGNLNISGSGSASLNNQTDIANSFPTGTLTLNMGSLAINSISDTGYIISNGTLSVGASAGDIILQTSAMGTQAYLQSQDAMTLSASGNFEILSGLGNAYVHSVGSPTMLTAGGNISVVGVDAQAYILADTTLSLSAGGNLVITSGLSDAYIRSMGTMNPVMITGDLLITANDSEAYLESDTDAPMIQVGGNVEVVGVNEKASIQASGNLGISSMGSVLVHADQHETAIVVQGGIGSSLSVDAAVGLDVLCTNNGPAYIANFVGPTTVTTDGSLSVISSLGVAGAAGFAGIGSGFTMPGNMIVTAADIAVEARSAPAVITTGIPAVLGGGGENGTLTLTATGPRGIALRGGSGMDASAEISTNGTAATNNITIGLTDPAADLILSSTSASTGAGARIVTVSGGDITINAAGGVSGRNLTMNSTTAASQSLISVGAMGGNLFAFMGTSIEVQGFSRIENLNMAGRLRLIADNDFPTTPGVGMGLFTLGADASLFSASGGNLFIYTSTNTNPETILGTMNGSSISMLEVDVNTPTAQWGMWFPDNPNMVAGMPFTVFYKVGAAVPTPVVPVVPTFFGDIQLDEKFLIVNGEAFQLWKTYFDRGIYVSKRIDVKYDRVDEMRLLVGENALSSFDLPPWSYLYFYQSRRNYNTLKLDPRM